jgi:NAD(P)-dependent dehydrogenase (short-subunit alcohol dehydrogenase family)
MKLLEKVAIVTGGATGNGKAIALGFAKEGASVAIIDIDEGGARETADEIKKCGRDSLFLKGDVSASKEVAQAVAATVERFGKIDILVNNAGVLSRVHFLDITEEEWDKTLRINLKGTFLCSQKVAHEMKKHGSGGAVINIASISGEVARPNTAPYVASKGGVRLLTKAMAVDLAKYNIRVNAIAPGYVRTSMIEEFLKDEAYHKKLLERIPLGYIASPEDLVGPAVFLASDDSRYVTGATLFVDGGWTAL